MPGFERITEEEPEGTTQPEEPSDRLPRVLHIVRPASGGIRRHVLTMLKHLPAAGVPVALMAPEEDAQEYRRTLPPGIDVYHAPLSESQSPVHDLIAATRIAYVVARRKIGILHFHGYRTAPVIWFTRRMAIGARRILTAHNVLTPGGGRRRRAAISAIRSSTHAIIANSEAVRQSLLRAGLDDRLVTVVYNGIGADEIVANGSRSELRRRFGVDEHRPLVACVARLMPDKGVDLLIDAARRVIGQVPDVAFLIAGDGPDRETLSERCQAPDLRGAVRMLGLREDAGDLIAASDCVAVPSREEGQSYVAVEAMARGIPWVGSRVGGLVEMARGGQTGVLVDPESPTDLAAGILSIIEGGPQVIEMLGRARGFALTDLSRDTMVAHTVEIYESVLGRHRH